MAPLCAKPACKFWGRRTQKPHPAFRAVQPVRRQLCALRGCFARKAGQSLRPLRRRHGRGAAAQGFRAARRRQRACLFLPSYRLAVCPSSMCRVCAVPSYAARAPFPIRPRPHAARRLGSCAQVRAARGFAPGAYLRARRAAFPFIPCARLCARRAASAPAVRARRLCFGLRLPRRAACPARRALARRPPSGLLFFVCAHSLRQPLRHLLALFFCVALYLARKRPPACAKIRSFPFFPSCFPSVSSVRFSLCAGRCPRTEKNGCRVRPGGPAAHAARCVSP